MGQQSAIARNNSSGAQIEQILGHLDDATREKLSETADTDSASDNPVASISENGR